MAGSYLTKVLDCVSYLLGQLLPQESAHQRGNNTKVLCLGSTDVTHTEQTKVNEIFSSTSKDCCKLAPTTKITWSSPKEAEIKAKGKMGTI